MVPLDSDFMAVQCTLAPASPNPPHNCLLVTAPLAWPPAPPPLEVAVALAGNDDATTLPLNQAAAGEATVVALHEKSIKGLPSGFDLAQVPAVGSSYSSPVTWHSGCSGSDCAELAACRLATAAGRRLRLQYGRRDSNNMSGPVCAAAAHCLCILLDQRRAGKRAGNNTCVRHRLVWTGMSVLAKKLQERAQDPRTQKSALLALTYCESSAK